MDATSITAEGILEEESNEILESLYRLYKRPGEAGVRFESIKGLLTYFLNPNGSIDPKDFDHIKSKAFGVPPNDPKALIGVEKFTTEIGALAHRSALKLLGLEEGTSAAPRREEVRQALLSEDAERWNFNRRKIETLLAENSGAPATVGLVKGLVLQSCLTKEPTESSDDADAPEGPSPEVRDLDAKVAKLTDDNDSLSLRVQSTSASLEESRQRILELEAANKELEAQLGRKDEDRIKLEEKNRELVSSRAEDSRKAAEVIQQLTDAKDVNAKLREDLSTARTAGALNPSLGQPQGSRMAAIEGNVLRARVARMEETVERLTKSTRSKDRELEELRLQVRRLTTEALENAPSKLAIESLEYRLQERIGRLEKLADELVAIRGFYESEIEESKDASRVLETVTSMMAGIAVTQERMELVQKNPMVGFFEDLVAWRSAHREGERERATTSASSGNVESLVEQPRDAAAAIVDTGADAARTRPRSEAKPSRVAVPST